MSKVKRETLLLEGGRRCMLAALCLSSFILQPSAFSQVPLQFAYQGRLTDSNGVPVTGEVTGIFRIVKGGGLMSGGDVVYAQTNPVIPDVNGVFSQVLGPVPLTAIADGTSSNRYMEAVINNETNLPRQQLLSVPYAIQAIVGTPPGTMQMFAGPTNNIPQGWLLCDGSAVSRAQHTNLYTAIGIAWGAGNGSTTFNLPDMRGRFPRGVTLGSPNDPDVGSRTPNGNGVRNEAGSVQWDAFTSHQHAGSTIQASRFVNTAIP